MEASYCRFAFSLAFFTLPLKDSGYILEKIFRRAKSLPGAQFLPVDCALTFYTVAVPFQSIYTSKNLTDRIIKFKESQLINVLGIHISIL